MKNQEEDFFHNISAKIIDLVSRQSLPQITKHKGKSDFATDLDVSVENLIVAEIKKRFPQDEILAEEGYSDSRISKKRIWIIDPICGTNNLARGIKNFCTNIALAQNYELVSSCVVDHNGRDYYWSSGNGKVYINNESFKDNVERFDVMIDVDFGATLSVGKKLREKHARFVEKLNTQNDFYLVSLNSSLGFAYTAIGRLDGFFNIDNHPWDISAAAFLIKQAGGTITDIQGNPWTLKSSGAIAAKNKDIHKKLLDAYLDS